MHWLVLLANGFEQHYQSMDLPLVKSRLETQPLLLFLPLLTICWKLRHQSQSQLALHRYYKKTFHDPRFGAILPKKANICFAGSRRYISSSATTQQALSSNVPKQPSMNLLRPRSFTASQAQAATNSRSPTLAQGGGLLQQGLFLPHHRHQCQLKKRPFSNHSYSRAPRETTEIPLMRCRLNTFQL